MLQARDALLLVVSPDKLRRVVAGRTTACHNSMQTESTTQPTVKRQSRWNSFEQELAMERRRCGVELPALATPVKLIKVTQKINNSNLSE